jgi:uncharacterized protein (DUF1778 family)
MKDDIISLRVDRETKKLIVLAAQIVGTDYKNFVTSTLKQVALQVIKGAFEKKVEEQENAGNNA